MRARQPSCKRIIPASPAHHHPARILGLYKLSCSLIDSSILALRGDSPVVVNRRDLYNNSKVSPDRIASRSASNKHDRKALRPFAVDIGLIIPLR